MALFAPGWVAEEAPAGAPWQHTAEQLWAALGAACRPPRPLAASLPFASSFDPGAGAGMYLEVRHFMRQHHGILPFLGISGPTQQSEDPVCACVLWAYRAHSCGRPPLLVLLCPCLHAWYCQASKSLAGGRGGA